MADIVDELPIAQSTVSQHLKELKDAGLIKGNIEGVATCYCIDEKAWNKAVSLLSGLLGKQPYCTTKLLLIFFESIHRIITINLKTIYMKTAAELKALVREKYSEIALQDKATNMSSCCGAGGCSTEVYNIMSDDYSNLNGYTEAG